MELTRFCRHLTVPDTEVFDEPIYWECKRSAGEADLQCGVLVHHSDRGVQYACGAYRQLLEANGLRASMSRKGNCWDNAVAESFFATLEWELIARRTWRTPDEARQDIFAYIETWYNRRRRHSSLDYRSPAQYETQLHHAA